MATVTSRVKLNLTKLRRLDQAAVTALEQTAEAVHTDLVQSQTMPFQTGALQNEGTFVDTTESSRGRVDIVSSTPYARRHYFHPEYHFYQGENPDAGGAWFAPYLEGGTKEHFPLDAFKKLYKKEADV